LNLTFVQMLLWGAVIAAAVGGLLAALVYAGGNHGSKRYRPGRPFEFRAVWFLARPDRQRRTAAGRELVAVRRSPAIRSARAKETGGASDRW
jgi:hypothetical protein